MILWTKVEGGDVGMKLGAELGTHARMRFLKILFFENKRIFSPFYQAISDLVAVKRARTVYQRGNQGGWRICTTRKESHPTELKIKTFGQN